MAIDMAAQARIDTLTAEIRKGGLLRDVRHDKMAELETLLNGGSPPAPPVFRLKPTEVPLADPAKQTRGGEIKQVLLDAATGKKFVGAHDRAALTDELAGLLTEPEGGAR